MQTDCTYIKILFESLRVGSIVSSHFVSKISGVFEIFGNRLCEIIFERSLKRFDTACPGTPVFNSDAHQTDVFQKKNETGFFISFCKPLIHTYLTPAEINILA